jgi:hypothetical protein
VRDAGKTKTILAHVERKRQPEEAGSPFEPGGYFRGTWQIGTRTFVLTNETGYEGFSVALMELIKGKGLVPAGPGFAAGC